MMMSALSWQFLEKPLSKIRQRMGRRRGRNQRVRRITLQHEGAQPTATRVIEPQAPLAVVGPATDKGTIVRFAQAVIGD